MAKKNSFLRAVRYVTAAIMVSAALCLGCPRQAEAPSPRPDPATDSDLCGAACEVIGPRDKGGLGCEEGQDIYDSDVPGPVDVPNVTCEQFCLKQQDAGAYLNPRCIMQVTSCDQIEAFRQRDCSEKK